MATRKPKTPELEAAASSLADAAHHVGRAVSQKVDEIGAAAAAELDTARKTAMARRDKAARRFDALLDKAEARLKKAIEAGVVPGPRLDRDVVPERGQLADQLRHHRHA